MAWRLLLFSKSREQKKLAPSFPSAKLVSAKVCAIVVFPVPANPFSQKTRRSFSSISHCSICRRTSLLVPFRHPSLFPERYPASAVWYIPLRSDRSAASYFPVNISDGSSSSWTHNELMVLKIDVLLQRSLWDNLRDRSIKRGEGTNLIIHHGVTDVLG